MHAHSLIPILSEKFDFPFDAARRIDRVLAEAGLRAKGKGRNLPDMDRREALTFLLACMVTDKITKANEEVLRWLSARGKVNMAPPPDDLDGWDTTDIEASMEEEHHKAMEAMIAPNKNQEGEVTLIDYLLAMCNLIKERALKPECVQLDIDFTDLNACVVLNDKHGDEFIADRFFVIDPTTDLPQDLTRRATGIKRKCSIKGIALLEIIDRT
ncbi:hypothetical protein [Falsihalocynthiibacter arcticus]|uniref:Uncharacterized protein n=1 Tax=Falsihalocynthiibacter arcticus TaxID=1579316 RepID=A0A126UWH0_9RHOB|nr:hypothetical protein [Falsihalocynthiibacter arcticus]AML50412.1 hypothetical protein RC74_03260 [Falsihalocynthiibacter arcticus]